MLPQTVSYSVQLPRSGSIGGHPRGQNWLRDLLKGNWHLCRSFRPHVGAQASRVLEVRTRRTVQPPRVGTAVTWPQEGGAGWSVGAQFTGAVFLEQSPAGSTGLQECLEPVSLRIDSLAFSHERSGFLATSPSIPDDSS